MQVSVALIVVIIALVAVVFSTKSNTRISESVQAKPKVAKQQNIAHTALMISGSRMEKLLTTIPLVREYCTDTDIFAYGYYSKGLDTQILSDLLILLQSQCAEFHVEQYPEHEVKTWMHIFRHSESMFRNIKCCYELASQCSDQYTTFVRMRPDIHLFHTFPSSEPTSGSLCLVPLNHCKRETHEAYFNENLFHFLEDGTAEWVQQDNIRGIGDHLFWGDRDVMQKVCNAYNNVDHIKAFLPEHMLLNQVQYHDIPTMAVHYDYILPKH
jgi:hypothetical protein